ncbi:hypothetical protein BCR36DRAFT_411255 [Piromyces finnis]|uniref:Uncharacterized protein n=1 Tax=Piromyces finnis TaxID=1754191 RepID=A0A1Y1VCT2_9FUNG|nr:hypothetical protein BCR36DRAFT_411255 [Piromyces finnis]|eukprot:ORX52889.1 hypothetical protein BCR36DRAFT_411255 [Piromyces finnis]
MFGASIKEKELTGSGYEVFLNVTTDILDHVNKTQYYGPSLSFILVLYTYIVIGEGKLWKNLLSVTFYGFIAVSLTSLFDTFKLYFTLDYVLQIKWLEAIFWHLNEYGYVYISYIKLQTVVNALKKKYWDYIMKGLFVYNIIVRFIIAAANVAGRTSSAGSHLQGLTFLPLALVEVVFMYLIIKTFIEQSNNNSMSKDIVSTMLTSSLTRMFLVALIYFVSSIVCFLYAPPILKGIKNTVWRAKAALGLIFLLDLLFIRIDLKEKMGYNGNNTGNSSNQYKKSTDSNNNMSLGNYSKYKNSSKNYSSTYNSISRNYKGSQYTFFNGSSEETSKFNLSQEPIVIRMNNVKTNYNPYEPLDGDKYINKYNQY